MNLIRVGFEVLNIDHIVHTKFRPFREWDDEVTGENVRVDASLTVHLSTGDAPVYDGADACNIWAALFEHARLQKVLPDNREFDPALKGER